MNVTYNDDNESISNYDITLESELYDNDYDEIYTMVDDDETKEETDIQFE